MRPLILCLFSLFVSGNAVDFSCRDQSNNPVDWFVFYKIARLTNMTNQDPHIKNGTGFVYLDSNNKKWTLSPMGMETNKQALGYTLQQYYDNQNDPDVTSVFWDDDLPYPYDNVSYATGHSKGFFAFGVSKGFWMTHSIPKFPRTDTYEFPSNAHYYGQMGLCVSLGIESLTDMAKQLYFIRPFVYSASVPTAVAAQVPLLQHVIDGEYQDVAPFTSLALIHSSLGQDFYHFGKAGGFGKDLYFDLVAPSLRVGLKAETWQHGSSNLFSWCRPPNPFPVFNVKAIALPFGIAFDNYYDHSKFAVGTNVDGQRSDSWVCIGDINRQNYQQQRGGGTMCINDVDLYDSFFSAVSDYYTCRPGD